MNRNMAKLGDHSFVTKLAGFEHTKYIQHNATHEINDVPLIIGKNIKNGKVIYEFDWYIPNEISDALPRSVLNKKCILIPYVGNLGELAIFNNEFKCHLGSNVAKVELTDDAIDLSYLYYYLRTSYGQSQLLRDKQGSVQANITMGAIRDTKIVLPEKATQQKIAAVLTALDAKIELNARINAELESMAKTLYDYWFVQFAPLSFGHPPKYDMETLGNTESQPVAFGGTEGGRKMVWNEALKREIPLGWEVKKFGEVASITAGGDKPNVFSLEKTDTCSVPIYSNGISDEGLYGYTDKAKITERSITVSARGTIGYCVLRTKPFVPIIRLIVITPYISFSTKYFEEYFKSFEFEKSGSVQQQLTVPQVSKIDVLYPPVDILKRYDEVTSPLISQIDVLKEESLQLAELRDWLLPMLMNGQVTVG